MEKLLLNAQLYDAKQHLQDLRNRVVLAKEGSVDEEILNEQILDQLTLIKNIKVKLLKFDK